MATPTKPGQRVMLTVGDERMEEGQIGLVARRLTDWFTEHRWNVRLDSGQVVEVRESDLFLMTD
jgi:hypothetical protein